MSYKIIVVFVLILLGVSCDSFVSGINNDPNNPTDAPVGTILTNAEVADLKLHGYRETQVAGMWSGYLTGVGRQFANFYKYQITSSELNTFYNNTYSDIFIQLKKAIEKFKQGENRLGMGISRVIQAHAIGTATALLGNIPFSQAGELEKYPNPKFDPQREVYNRVQDLLDKAIGDLKSGVGTLNDKIDIYFNGNANQWIEVAYTLKARFYTETGEYDKAYNAALKGISKPSNSMLGPTTTTEGKRNPFYVHQVQDRAGDVNANGALITKILNPKADNYRGNKKTNERARFHYYFVNLGSNGITGDIEPNYLTRASRGDAFNGAEAMDADVPLVTYRENLLILAETAARTRDFSAALSDLNRFRGYMNSGGYIDPTYTEAYPVEYDPYVEADFTKGGMNNFEGITKEEALLKEILEERWVTFWPTFLGFNDVRRTRDEAVGIHLEPSIGNKLPERLLYSQTAISSNKNAPDPLPGIFEPTPVNSNR